MKKVFISSVMRDFKAQRGAAKAAVESLRLLPVMAEDFGAKPYSSQTACLEGVRQSAIYVGILGVRYGFVANSGLSVTREEFNEARKRGLPLLVFVEKGDLEPQQKAFVDEIKGYEDGLFLDFFDSPAQLQTKVTKALYDHVGQPDVTTLTGEAATKHVTKYLTAHRNNSQSTVIGAIMFPARQGDEYLSSLDLGDQARRRRLEKVALFGDPALLQTARGTIPFDGETCFGFAQRGLHEQFGATIQLFQDGTIVWHCAPEVATNLDYSLAKRFVMDQDDIEQRLRAFAGFAEDFLKSLDASPLISNLYMTVSFENLQHKWFGHAPSQPVSSMSMAMDNLDEPLLIPMAPLKIARAELADPAALAAKLTAVIERTFKAKKRYYVPSR